MPDPRACGEAPEQGTATKTPRPYLHGYATNSQSEAVDVSEQGGDPSNMTDTATGPDHFITGLFQGRLPARRTAERDVHTAQGRHGQAGPVRRRDQLRQNGPLRRRSDIHPATQRHRAPRQDRPRRRPRQRHVRHPRPALLRRPLESRHELHLRPPDPLSTRLPAATPHGSPNRPERQEREQPQPGTENNRPGTPGRDGQLRHEAGHAPRNAVPDGSFLLGFLRHAGQRLRVELGVDGPGPTLCSSWTFLEIFIEQHSNRTSTVGRFRDYSAARLPTRSSSPNEPWERAFMCQALRSKAAPWRRFAAARPWSQARSPSL